MLNVDSIESLKNAVLDALASVYENDYFLIEKCCHELTVVAAFFRAFCEQNQIANEQIKVDMEYSRMGEFLEAKPASSNEHGKKHMRIDFVIHPGETLKEFIVINNISEKHINAIINGKSFSGN